MRRKQRGTQVNISVSRQAKSQKEVIDADEHCVLFGKTAAFFFFFKALSDILTTLKHTTDNIT